MSEMRTVRCAVIDTETTGLGEEDKIVEFAAVPVCFEHELGSSFGLPISLPIEIGEGKSGLINPMIPIPYEAMGVHHITDEMVQAEGGEAEHVFDNVLILSLIHI